MDAQRMSMIEERLSRDQETIKAWIAAATGAQIGSKNLQEQLADGVLLCKLVNATEPNTIPTILTEADSPIQFLRAYENTTNFIEACKKWGLPKDQLFEWADLAKNQNFPNVVKTLCNLRIHILTNKHKYASSEDMKMQSVEVSKLISSPSPAPRGLLGVLEDSEVTSTDATPIAPNHVHMDFNVMGAANGHLQAHGWNLSRLMHGVSSPATGSAMAAMSKLFGDTNKHSTETELDNDEDMGLADKENSGSTSAENSSSEEPCKTSTVEEESEILKGTPKKKAKNVLRTVIGDPMKTVSASFRSFSSDVKAVLQDFNTEMSLTCQTLSEALEIRDVQLTQFKSKFLVEQSQRKALLNKVIELQGNIRVYCRVRPFSKSEKAEQIQGAVQFPEAEDTERLSLTLPGSKTKDKAFKFDRVFRPGSSQQDVFQDVAPFVQSALDGYNVCIFAYGQTGTGKTYTMEGPRSDEGVNYRALRDLFATVEQKQDTHSVSVAISVVEIYNEEPRDLLMTSKDYANQSRLQIKQGPDGIYIPDLTKMQVSGTDQVIDIMHNVAYKNRKVGSTSMNEHSSRSHCLLFVTINGRNLINGETTEGKLVMIDLAGSERVKRSEAAGERLKEAQNINRSLSALGNVISALQQNQPHIPFRDSKLTYILQDCLSGNSKCLMFCQVSPCATDYQESLCSLQFATRASKCELGAAKKNSQSGDVLKIKTLLSQSKDEAKSKEQELAALKEQLHAVDSAAKSKDSSIKELERKLAAAEAQMNRLETERTTLKDQLWKEKKSALDATKEVSALQAELAASKQAAARAAVKLKAQAAAPKPRSAPLPPAPQEEKTGPSTGTKRKSVEHVDEPEDLSSPSSPPPTKTPRQAAVGRVNLRTPLTASQATRTPLASSSFSRTLQASNQQLGRSARPRRQASMNDVPEEPSAPAQIQVAVPSSAMKVKPNPTQANTDENSDTNVATMSVADAIKLRQSRRVRFAGGASGAEAPTSISGSARTSLRVKSKLTRGLGAAQRKPTKPAWL